MKYLGKLVLWWIISFVLNSATGLCSETMSSQEPRTTRIVVTYIGNEGFMIDFPSKKVLIDVLVSHDYPDYVEI